MTPKRPRVLDLPFYCLETAQSEFSREFLQGMINRMTMSQFKYGNVADAYPDKLNAIISLLMRLRAYVGLEAFDDACAMTRIAPDHREVVTTGNTEYLIDLANFAMIEFMHPKVPGAFFEPTDANQSPGRAWATGTVNDKANHHESDAVKKRLYKQDGD